MKSNIALMTIGTIALLSLHAESPHDTTLSFSVTGMESASVSAADASYAASLGSLKIEHRLFHLGYQVLQFDWTGTLPGQQRDVPPWEYLKEISIGMGSEGHWDDNLTYGWLLGAQAAFETELDESVTPIGYGFIRYALRPNLEIIAGIFGSRHPEVRTDQDLIPVLGLLWQPRSLPAVTVSLGLPRTYLSWSLSEQSALRLELSTLEGGVYRLEDETPLEDVRYLEFEGATLGLYFDRQFGRFLLTAGVLMPLEREFELHDRQGRQTREFTVEKRPAFTLSLRYVR